MTRVHNIRIARKKVIKQRYSFMLSESATNALIALLGDMPEHSASQVVGDALRFAFTNEMYKVFGAIPKSKRSIIANTDSRERWCFDCGGESNGVTCRFTKYEKTPTGMVARSPNVEVPLKQLPHEQVAFRKFILGGFASVDIAEEAYKAQATSNIPTERVLGKK